MKILCALILITVFSYCSARLSNVTQCDPAHPIENLKEKVTVGACKKPPCRLRKNTLIKVQFQIKPTQDVEKLINSVHAKIVGIPFPFIGFDGTDACQYIYSADGKDKVGCPLKKGEEYLYKSSIEVLQIYPKVRIIVHWALSLDENGTNNIFCVEVPARITN